MSISDNKPCSSKSISTGMSDDERYELLKDRVITVPYFDVDVLAQIDAGDYAELERIGKSGAFKILREIKRSRILGHTPEGFSIATQEAVASGVRCLTSDKNPAAELIPCGSLPLDKALWLKKLSEAALSNARDTGAAERLRKQGFDIRERIVELDRIYAGE